MPSRFMTDPHEMRAMACSTASATASVETLPNMSPRSRPTSKFCRVSRKSKENLRRTVCAHH